MCINFEIDNPPDRLMGDNEDAVALCCCFICLFFVLFFLLFVLF